MLVKTKATLGEEAGVRFVNGVVSLGPVNLNVYCFEIDGVLIDSGAASLLHKFKPFFQKANFDKIMITHDHEDHTGGAAFLQKMYNVPIYINRMSASGCEDKATYPLYRKLFWGKREPFYATPIKETFESRHAIWDVIATPGHSADHLSFLNKETGQLFSGDLYVHPKTKVILRNECIPTTIASLKKILTYDFTELFCCHAGYVNDGRKALTKKLEYLVNFRSEVIQLHGQGFNEKAIMNKMFKKKYPITYLSFGEWDSVHMIRSILST